MPNLLQYLVIHCTDTPETMRVEKGDLEQWHKGPRDNADGTVTYLGVTYKNRSFLPKDNINGQEIYHLTGRGWDRLGYSELFHRRGDVTLLTPYNDNDIVEQFEVTWGATGVNAIARHIVLEGGWKGDKHSGTFPFLDIFTPEQYKSLVAYLDRTIHLHPKIKIVGHRDIPNANKTCPNFDVAKFCTIAQIPKINTIAK